MRHAFRCKISSIERMLNFNAIETTICNDKERVLPLLPNEIYCIIYYTKIVKAQVLCI